MVVKVDKHCLIVRGGNTHYPVQAREMRFFRGSLSLPPRIVTLDGSGTVTLDALDWMAEQGVAFVRVNYDGSQAIASSTSGYAANPEKVGWQLETRDSPKKQLAFGISITQQKLEAALETLRDYVQRSDEQSTAIQNTEKVLLQLPKAKSVSALLSMEGAAARAYWTAWRGLSLKWKAQSRYPIPDEWRTYSSRASLLSGVKYKNWRASHPINAMLNYAYAVLLTEMKVKAITDGYDPMIGIYHDQRHYDKDRTASFALDLMEPLRPAVDRSVLQLIAEECFSGGDFHLQSDGVCRLNPSLAKLVALKASQQV